MMSPSARPSFRAALLGLVVATGVVTAQGPERGRPIRLQPVAPTAQRLEPIREGRGAFERLRRGERTVTVHGIVQNHLGELVPRAGTVVIRSLVDGSIAGQTEVDALAQFTIRGFDPGLYAAELVGQSGSVIATSSAFTAGIGEVIQLAPVIPVAPVSGVLSALGSATSSVVSSAASAGVLAVAPGEPVSP